MTAEDRRDPYREWDAAYVLGALEPAERRELEEHLEGCPECRASVAELAGLPGMLRALTPEDARALAGAPGTAPGTPAPRAADEVVSLARAVRARRRRGRWIAAAAAAACLALGALVGVTLPRPSDAVQAEVVRVRLEPVGAADVRADLTMRALAWGTRLDWSCEYPGPVSGYAPTDVPVYELVVVDDEGGARVVATWRGHDGGTGGLGASSAVPARDIARVEIRVEGASDALASADV